jgi:amidase
VRADEYASLDAVALATAVRAGELSPLEIVDAAITAIVAVNPTLNAVVLTDFDRARENARKVPRILPLSGVPFLIKDVDVFAEEWPTTMSSRFLSTAKPRPDSEIVKRWRSAGTVFLGKTNTPEFADDFATEPVYRGTTLNPWNVSVTVGGSSGGAAAAVASGMVPAAHGSDVGGSIRIPAACCGVFGLKPSRGLNPIEPHFGARGGGLNCQHILSRSVRDSAAFLDATAGQECGAQHGVQRPVKSYLAALKQPTGPLSVVCLPRRMDGTQVAPEIEESLIAATALLQNLGHSVTVSHYPSEVARAMHGESWTLLWMADVALAIEERAAELGRAPEADEIESLARWIHRHVAGKSALDYLEAQRVAHLAALAMSRAFDTFDIIMTPTTATLPPPVGTFGANATDFRYERWSAAAYGFAPFTEIFNVTGQPAASLPLYLSRGDIPIGIQLVARQLRDELLLQLAAALEDATGWMNRHPSVWAGTPRN